MKQNSEKKNKQFMRKTLNSASMSTVQANFFFLIKIEATEAVVVYF